MPLVFTIVLCTRNRARLLTKALASLREIDYPRDGFELVLVDNDSSDDTGEVARSFSREAPFEVRAVRETRIGLSAARNRAIREARGEYLFFTDDDQLVDRQVLREHERVARAYQSRVQQGAIALTFPGGRPAWLHGELATMLGETADVAEGRADIDLYGGNMLLRRDLLMTLTSAFREDLGKGAAGYSEDIELTRRLRERGERIVYAPTARIYHVIEHDRATPRFFVKNAFDKGYSDGLLLARREIFGEARHALMRGARLVIESARTLVQGDEHGAIVARTRAANQLGRLLGCAAARKSSG
jgi:glycosyltransferase involved in cell wall biosynthesis